MHLIITTVVKGPFPPGKRAIYTRRMSAINTIFFDWGGVIAGDPDDGFWANLLKDRGATHAQAAEIYDTYMQRFMRGEISEEECWNELRQHYGLVIPENISEEFKKWKGLIKNDDVVALIDEARSAGLQVALLTNVIEPTYNVLSDTGNYDYFDEVIASCRVGYAKPQTEIYQLALEKLHTTAEQSLFIDDKQKNLDPATQMGFTTILATDSEQTVRDVMKYIPA
jgi:putative hydrolase of the HAD superfamily